MIRLEARDNVLDMGCGTGRQALSVSEIIGPAGWLTGIDTA